MKEHQRNLINNGMAIMNERLAGGDMFRAGQVAEMLGYILISWAKNGKMKVYKKNGEIKKKYKKS